MLTAAAFLIFYFGCAALALLKHPIYGLYLYLAVVYLHPPSRWWGQMLPDLRWSLLAAAVTLIAIFVKRGKLPPRLRPWYATVPGLAVITLVVWLWIQYPWALDQQLHHEAAVLYTKYIVSFYLVYRLVNRPADAANVLLVHVLGCAFLGVLCLLNEDARSGARLDGVGGPNLDDANSLGMFLATGVVVGGVLFLWQTGWRRLVVVLAMPFVLNGLVLTGSRGAFIGLLVAGFVLLFLRPPQRRWMFWGAAALGVVLAVKLMDEAFIERMFSIRDAAVRSEEMDSSAESRWVLIEAQTRMAVRYPHGTGHRGTAVLSPQYLDSRWLTRGPGESADDAARASHNTFMTLLVEQGIPGALLYLWMSTWGALVVLRLKLAIRRKLPLDLIAPATACAAGIAVVWTAGQFADYLKAEVQIWLFAMLAVTLEQLRLAASPSREMPGAGSVPAHAGPEATQGVQAAGGSLRPAVRTRIDNSASAVRSARQPSTRTDR
jgi:hypothetical protein